MNRGWKLQLKKKKRKSFLSPVWQTPFYSMMSEHRRVCRPCSRCGLRTSLASCLMVSHPSPCCSCDVEQIRSRRNYFHYHCHTTKSDSDERGEDWGESKICYTSNLCVLACWERTEEWWAKFLDFLLALSPLCWLFYSSTFLSRILKPVTKDHVSKINLKKKIKIKPHHFCWCVEPVFLLCQESAVKK